MLIIIALIALYCVLYTTVVNTKTSKEDWSDGWEYSVLMARLDKEAEQSPVAVMLRNIR